MHGEPVTPILTEAVRECVTWVNWWASLHWWHKPLMMVFFVILFLGFSGGLAGAFKR